MPTLFIPFCENGALHCPWRLHPAGWAGSQWAASRVAEHSKQRISPPFSSFHAFFSNWSLLAGSLVNSLLSMFIVFPSSAAFPLFAPNQHSFILFSSFLVRSLSYHILLNVGEIPQGSTYAGEKCIKEVKWKWLFIVVSRQTNSDGHW